MFNPSKSDVERFWSKVNKTDTCWIWIGSKRCGYGAFKYNYHVYGAHQFSWMLHFGKITLSLDVCHHCDNRDCVNPEHLFLGSRRDNMQDASVKGRLISSQSKLDHESVRQIRFLYSKGVGSTILAKEFGLAKSNIQNIVNRKTYKYVT